MRGDRGLHVRHIENAKHRGKDIALRDAHFSSSPADDDEAQLLNRAIHQHQTAQPPRIRQQVGKLGLGGGRQRHGRQSLQLIEQRGHHLRMAAHQEETARRHAGGRSVEPQAEGQRGNRMIYPCPRQQEDSIAAGELHDCGRKLRG